METKNWKWFKYNEIFEIKKGKRLTKADMINGDIPYIGATDSNNGITAKISNDEHLHSANTITVSYNGSIAEAYYQTKEFWATDDVNVLYPKFAMNAYSALFCTTIINKEKYRFNYGRKWDKELMNVSTIKLPVDNNGNPDWQWIENYVKETLIPQLPAKTKSVWKKEFDKTPLSPNKLQLNTKEWKWFKYIDVFEIKKGKRLTKADMVVGKIPYIGAIDSNNGVSSYISNNEQLHSANTITVSYNGSIAEAYYQAKEFWATDDVNVLYPKFLMNAYSALFLTTIINKEKYRFNYGRKWDKELMESSKIKLPINEQGEPDWQWIEDYIKGLPYSGCL
jgi:hypothetical protein